MKSLAKFYVPAAITLGVVIGCAMTGWRCLPSAAPAQGVGTDLVKHAPPGSPNLLIIVLDDLGFSQLGCFGGLCATPVLDNLAKNGLRYNNFHTTAMCSPTRSCLLTGRNHHKNNFGVITEYAT